VVNDRLGPWSLIQFGEYFVPILYLNCDGWQSSLPNINNNNKENKIKKKRKTTNCSNKLLLLLTPINLFTSPEMMMMRREGHQDKEWHQKNGFQDEICGSCRRYLCLELFVHVSQTGRAVCHKQAKMASFFPFLLLGLLVILQAHIPSFPWSGRFFNSFLPSLVLVIT
jgi:hypothetical protein